MDAVVSNADSLPTVKLYGGLLVQLYDPVSHTVKADLLHKLPRQVFGQQDGLHLGYSAIFDAALVSVDSSTLLVDLDFGTGAVPLEVSPTCSLIFGDLVPDTLVVFDLEVGCRGRVGAGAVSTQHHQGDYEQ